MSVATSWAEIEVGLKAPWDEQDIEWRIAQSGLKDGRPWAKVLAYVESRTIMDRFDRVVGPENWQDQFIMHEKAVLCGIGIRCAGEWVWKWDGAEQTDVEAVKGGLSDAFKRAFVKWGNRDLYRLGTSWAQFCEPGVKGRYQDRIGGKEGAYFHWNPPPPAKLDAGTGAGGGLRRAAAGVTQ